jgi:hypothetical protein
VYNDHTGPHLYTGAAPKHKAIKASITTNANTAAGFRIRMSQLNRVSSMMLPSNWLLIRAGETAVILGNETPPHEPSIQFNGIVENSDHQLHVIRIIAQVIGTVAGAARMPSTGGEWDNTSMRGNAKREYV